MPAQMRLIDRKARRVGGDTLAGGTATHALDRISYTGPRRGTPARPRARLRRGRANPLGCKPQCPAFPQSLLLSVLRVSQCTRPEEYPYGYRNREVVQ
jgi:hypothetical protein